MFCAVEMEGIIFIPFKTRNYSGSLKKARTAFTIFSVGYGVLIVQIFCMKFVDKLIEWCIY